MFCQLCKNMLLKYGENFKFQAKPLGVKVLFTTNFSVFTRFSAVFLNTLKNYWEERKWTYKVLSAFDF